SVLRDLERGSRVMRDPDWYFFTIFGTPAPTTKWGWRVDGHHLSLNFTMEGERVIAATPAFFGANPAVPKTDAQAGRRPLPEAEEWARELFVSLDNKQRSRAHQGGHFVLCRPRDADVIAGDVVEMRKAIAAEKGDS